MPPSRANASLEVHEMLRQQRLPPMDRKVASQQGARALDGARCRSLQAIHADQPEVIVQSITQPSGVGAPKAAYRFFENPSPSAIRMLELLDGWGANWDLPRVVSLVESQPLEKQREWEIQRRKLLEARMDKTFAGQDTTPARRARL